MSAVKGSNMEVFKIDFYEGSLDNTVKLRFDNREAYNDFLNWLVLPINRIDSLIIKIKLEKNRRTSC